MVLGRTEGYSHAMTKMTLVSRTEWRGRGRPKTRASQEVIDALQQTSGDPDGLVGRVPLDAARGTAARASEVAQYRRELNAAGRVLNVQVRTQIKDDVLLFYQEPITGGTEDD